VDHWFWVCFLFRDRSQILFPLAQGATRVDQPFTDHWVIQGALKTFFEEALEAHFFIGEKLAQSIVCFG
jgi:hypothetical protein